MNLTPITNKWIQHQLQIKICVYIFCILVRKVSSATWCE